MAEAEIGQAVEAAVPNVLQSVQEGVQNILQHEAVRHLVEHETVQQILAHETVKKATDLIVANKPAAAAAAVTMVLTTGCLCLRKRPEIAKPSPEALPKSAVAEDASVCGTVSLTAIEGSLVRDVVELEEVVDGKGRRLIVASAHAEVPMGVKVDSLNGMLVTTVEDAQRALGQVAVTATHTLLLGTLTLTLDPIEACEDEKKASPIVMKPEERAQAKALLKPLARAEQVNVTVSPPIEGLDAADAPPPISLTSYSPKGDDAPGIDLSFDPTLPAAPPMEDLPKDEPQEVTLAEVVAKAVEQAAEEKEEEKEEEKVEEEKAVEVEEEEKKEEEEEVKPKAVEKPAPVPVKKPKVAAAAPKTAKATTAAADKSAPKVKKAVKRVVKKTK